MLDLIASWVVFPSVLAVASVAIGVLIARPRDPVQGSVAPATGFAALIVISQLCLLGRFGAVLAGALALGLVAWGICVAARASTQLPGAAGFAAAVVFLMSAAPVVLTGTSTFLGYTVLGDSAIQMLGADALGSGAGIGAPDSSAGIALDAYFGQSGYPSGALTLLGLASHALRQDVAWTYQPFLAVAAGLLALVIFSLSLEARMRRPWAIAAAILGATPALLFAYYLQGSIKEVVAALLVPLIGAQVAVLRHRAAAGWRLSDALPMALTSAALTTVVGLAAAVWIVPALVILVVSMRRERPDSGTLARVVSFGLLVYFIGSAGAWFSLRDYLEVAGTVTTAQSELGNLITPLRKVEATGIWLSGDYRVQPAGGLWAANQVLQVLVLATALLGGWAVLRARAWGAGCFVLCSVVGMMVVSHRGSPWADAKAYAIVAPAVVFVALAGTDWLSRAQRLPRAGRISGVAVGSAIAIGVFTSNAMSYGQASPAPRSRFEELHDLVRGSASPVLAPDFDEFAKYFLRDAAANIPGDTWHVRSAALGSPAPGTRSLRTADLSPATREEYPTIVARRDAFSVAPPGYRLARAGEWYDVWVVDRRLSDVVVNDRNCHHALRTLVASMDATDRLRWVSRPAAIRSELDVIPANWRVSTKGDGVDPRGGGIAQGEFVLGKRAKYRVWLELDSQASVSLAVDGIRLGPVAQRLNEPWGAENFGEVVLSPGSHTWRVEVSAAGIAPGSNSSGRWVKGIQLTALGSPDSGLAEMRSWRELCRPEVSWVGLDSSAQD